jgi:subtilisin family serine protease
MATPHVSAVAALLAAAQPRSTAKALRARLDASARDLLAPGRDPATGYGLVDLAAALGNARR